jgi:hypothetical protein
MEARAGVDGASLPSEKATSRLSSILLSAAAFTSSWTAVEVGNVKVVDLALLLAAAATALAWMGRSRRIYLEWWMFAFPLGAGLTTVIDAFARQDDLAANQPYIISASLGTTLIAVLIRSEIDARGASRAYRLLRWWAAGVVVNAAAAVLLDWGLITLGNLTPPPGKLWRAYGLTFHPNSLAFSLVLCLPVLILLMSRRQTIEKYMTLLWLIACAVVLRALFLADSRAGLAVGLAAGAAAMLVAVRGRRGAGGLLAAVAVAAIALTLWGGQLFAGTRLTAGGGDLSDLARAGINAGAADAFWDNPLFGAGLGQQSGVAVPLQLLSGGGLLLACSYYLFILAPVRALLTRPRHTESWHGLVVLGAVLTFGLVQPGLSERATFWPTLLIAAALVSRRQAADKLRASSDSRSAAAGT